MAGTCGPRSAPTLVAFDPASGEATKTLDQAADAGTAFDGTHTLADRRVAHRQDRPRHRRRAGLDPCARGVRLGPRLGRGEPLGGATPQQADQAARPGDGRGAAQHRVEQIRHRRDLGRGRAVARHLGRRRERDPSHRPRPAAPCSTGWRCRPAPASAGWNRMAPTCSMPEAAAAAPSAPCAVTRPDGEPNDFFCA